MVIGTAPYEFIAQFYSKPMVVAGFEPLDILQSIWMVLQADQGRPLRDREPICAHRARSRELRRRYRLSRGSMNCANSLSGAGSARSIIPG